MSDFEKQKFEIEELILLLEPYTDGELSFLLNAKENVDIVHDKLIAFDMEDASKKEYFPLVAIITLQMIVDKIKKRQGMMKELIIDEALDFLQDEKVRRLHSLSVPYIQKERGKHHSGSTEYPFPEEHAFRNKGFNYHQLCYKDNPGSLGAPPEPAGNPVCLVHQ